MRTHRIALAAVALLASTAFVSCGSDDDTPSNDSGVPIVGDTTVAVDTLPIVDTVVVDDTTAP